MANILTQNTSPRMTQFTTWIALLFFLPLLFLVTYQTATLISRATGTKANIVVDVKAITEPIKTDFYHAFSQGGEESADMLASIIPEIRALKPKLIRLDHIYDHYDVVSRSGSGLAFDFSKLDKAVDSVLATGARPLLALSFMPQAIAQGGSVINPPDNWDDWALVVQRTIEHFSGHGGRNLGGVYYEVWNEPDLAQFGSWKMGGDKNYLTLYRYAATGAKNAQNVNGFLLGGPATTGLYKSWMIGLVTSGYRLDFLSWHTYLSDPKRFDTDQRNLISWLLPYPGYTLLPKLITEFGFTGNKSRGYGTTYAAAHTAAVIRQLISGGPTYALSFQPKDGPGQQSGDGWGLVTHDDNGKKPKPRYYVYNFIDTMAGNRVNLTGEGTWVTGFATTKDKTTRVLLVNFDQNGSHGEDTPLTFVNLDPGTYTYRLRYLFGKSPDGTTETVTETSLSKTITMYAQSVVIAELTKQ